jgi:uncharacterized membrane protein
MARRQSFLGDFRTFFIKGLGIILPTILTLWLLWMAAQFVFNNVAQPINRGIRAVVVWAVPEFAPQESLPKWARVTDLDVATWRSSAEGQPEAQVPDDRARTIISRQRLRTFWNDRWYLAGTGLVVAIVLIYLAGVLLGGLIGRRVYARLEAFLARVPGFKQVYPHVKQLVEMIMGDRPIAFNKVVLVEYPRKGIWTVGFVTGDSLRAVHEAAGRECISVFVPSTPAPFTGFTISVPVDETVDLPISIEEAIRFFVTGGVLVPPRQAPQIRTEQRPVAAIPSQVKASD